MAKRSLSGPTMESTKVREVARSQAFDRMHSELLMRTQQLKLVSNALNEPATAGTEDAARYVLPEIVKGLDNLHRELDLWNVQGTQP